MRAHYPKLRNIVHTISLSMLLLLPKDQTFIFYLLLVSTLNYIIDYQFYLSGSLSLDTCHSRYLPLTAKVARGRTTHDVFEETK